jgi:ubiquinone/menaquinone biosynthesis C-methylase UbiE
MERKNMKAGFPDTKSGGHTCPWWLLFTFDNPLRKLVHNPKKMLAPYVRPSDTVLDVGCGMGYFTLGLAQLVGSDGKVIATDLQTQMLAGLRKRAERVGLVDHIQLHQSTPDQIGVNQPVDFALAFWMVHEVRQPEDFLLQIYEQLTPTGKFLLAEPIIHVTGKAFARTVSLAKRIGFVEIERPGIFASRVAVFSKEAPKDD